MKIFQTIKYSLHNVDHSETKLSNDEKVFEFSICTEDKTICSYTVVGTKPTDCRLFVVCPAFSAELIRQSDLIR